MVILGVPSNLSAFIMVDSYDAFDLEQRGFHPMYRDGDMLYFKRSRKILKIIQKLKIEL